MPISNQSLTFWQICIAIALVGGLAIIYRIFLSRIRISWKVWLSAAIVAVLALFYFQLRLPQPNINDISYQVSLNSKSVTTVTGKVVTEPRLNTNHKIKFWLKAETINEHQKVSGKLYVTLPLLQSTGLNLGENIKLKGILYRPQNTSIPGSFDFKSYLSRQGIFSAMQGLEIVANYNSEPNWGWWKVRRRIVRSHLKGLGSPRGQLVSSMVLGRKAVNLPVDIRDRFIEAGLAHVLAASGFHVSLLLGLILKLTNRFPGKIQLTMGICTLVFYLGLTGIQASVLRACLMGSAVLVALVLETKVKPLGSLLLVATIILLLNPLLIQDLGFQLSFLATFGLIVTMPELQTALNWLPPTIATLVAIPLAASIWVIPLLCYEFKVVATYSIVVNIICTPLIIVISLGGMISGIVSILLPEVGSAIAWLLFYPTSLLINGINLVTHLPGSTWTVGKIPLGVLFTIYGLLLLTWLNKQWSKNWRWILLSVITLITIPIGYQHFNLTQITILPIQPEPVIVIQDRGKEILINSGQANKFKYQVLPFLTYQGINNLDYLINLDQQFLLNSVKKSSHISIKKIFTPLKPPIENQINSNFSIQTNSFLISGDLQNSLIKLETATEIWLILGKTKLDIVEIQQYIQHNQIQDKPINLISSHISSEWLELKPKNILSLSLSKKIIRQNTPMTNSNFYNLKHQGAVSWTPKDGFRSATDELSFNSIF